MFFANTSYKGFLVILIIDINLFFNSKKPAKCLPAGRSTPKTNTYQASNVIASARHSHETVGYDKKGTVTATKKRAVKIRKRFCTQRAKSLTVALLLKPSFLENKIMNYSLLFLGVAGGE